MTVTFFAERRCTWLKLTQADTAQDDDGAEASANPLPETLGSFMVIWVFFGFSVQMKGIPEPLGEALAGMALLFGNLLWLSALLPPIR